MSTIKNSISTTLIILVIVLILSGFYGFRISRQMITPTPGTTGQNHPFGKLTKSGIFDKGARHYKCYGFLLLNMDPVVTITEPVISLLDENQQVLTEAVFFDSNGNDFSIKIPEGSSGIASIEASGSYRIHTKLLNNGLFSLHSAGKFTGTVRGHAFVLRGEKLPEPEPLPRTTLIIESSKGWKQEVQTDGRGEFSVAVPPGPFTVLIRSDSHTDAYFDDLSVKVGEVLDRQIILPAGCELEGFVLGDQTTLKGAKVRVVTAMEDDAEVVAGERGLSKLKGLSQGMAEVFIQHPGYQEQSFSLLIPGDKIGIRKPFLLKPSEESNVTVTLGDNLSIPNASIRVTRSGQLIFEGPAEELNQSNILASGVTYNISAHWNPDPKNPDSLLHSPKIRWTMPASGPGEIKLSLTDSCFIKGVVQTAQGWQPFGGTSIQVSPIETPEGDLPETITLWCNSMGRFKTPGLPLGKYAVTAYHPRFGVHGKIIHLTEPGEFTVGFITLPE